MGQALQSPEPEELPDIDPFKEPDDHPDYGPSDEDAERGLETWREVDDTDDESNGMDEGGE